MSDWKRGLHDLLVRVALHDEDAFARMYEVLYRTAIATILAEIGGIDEADAESIYCQAMYKIWRKAGSYQGREERQDPDTTAWAWIRTTIVRTALDVSRSLRKKDMAELLESEMINEAEQDEGQDSSPIDQLSASDVAVGERMQDSPAKLTEAREGLHEFLGSLEERDKLIFRLLAEGHPQGEVAQRLGISASRLSQIVHALRDKAEVFFQP